MLGKCFCDGLTVWGLLAVPRLLVCHGGHVLYLFMTLESQVVTEKSSSVVTERSSAFERG
jgi:hypothetical protein